MNWGVGCASGVNVFLCRHLAIYMAICLCAGTVDLYKTSEGDEILRSPPSNPTLIPSLRIESVIVRFHFFALIPTYALKAPSLCFPLYAIANSRQAIFSVPWIFFVQYVNVLALYTEFENSSKRKGLSTLCAITDLILGIWLALAVQWQTTFLPPTQGQCYDDSTWSASNSSEIIFQRLGFLEGSLASDVCDDLVGYWKLAVILTAMTLFASLIEFLNGSFMDFYKLCWAIGAGILPVVKFVLTRGVAALPQLLWGLAVLLYNSILWLVIKLGLFIPRRLAPPVRYRSRYLKRSREKQVGLPTHELRLWMVSPPNEKHISIEPCRSVLASNRSTVIASQLPAVGALPAPLLRLIFRPKSDTVLLRIIYFLHYTDVVNLSLTSKGVRAELFKSSSHVEALRMASCIPAKFECYCCNTQICNSCQKSLSLRMTHAQRHLHSCVIHCSDCYRKKICSPKTIHSPPVCNCGLEATATATTTMTRSAKALCRSCEQLGNACLEIREMRERSEIVHLAGQELKCGSCKRRLPSRGVRWWVCGKCGMECTSNVHPQWAKAATEGLKA